MLFKKPIVEFSNGKDEVTEKYASPLKLTLKVETMIQTKSPITFKFIHTDGSEDKALKEANLPAGPAKKQKFSVTLDLPKPAFVG